jgi:hypothetical protein
VIDLPRDLAPWRASLDLFSPDVAEGLGPLLPRLALAIGPMRISRPTGDGEPDGFLGIARRGSYERLLLTEWLLADEAPLEFARRAATGEHAFFQLARRAPAHAMSSVAILDAGPLGLGAPRIAHLATLIVLAARAEKAGARFAWGLLHAPDRALFPAVTKESLQSLLAGRSAIGASAEDDAAWIERAAKSQWEDAWIVGARSTVPGWKHGAVEVRDLYDPERRALAVGVRSPGAPPRACEIDLPPDRIAARLLTDPFAPPPKAAPQPPPSVQPPPKHLPVPTSNLVFAANGTKVFARSQHSEIISYSTTGGRAKRYRPRGGGVVAAVGWVSRGCVMLVIDEDVLRIQHNVGDPEPMLSRSHRAPDSVAVVAPHICGPLSPLIFTPAFGDEIFFADARRALFQITPDASGTRNHRAMATSVGRIAEEVAAVAPVGNRCVHVGRGDDDRWRIAWSGTEPKPTVDLEGDGTFEAHFGALGASDPLTVVAVQQRHDLWTVYQHAKAIDDLRPPQGARVVGAWRPVRDARPALIAIDPDQRTLLQIGSKGTSTLEVASAPIVDAVVSTTIPAIAYATTAGDVAIRSLAGNHRIGYFQPKDIR